MLDKNKTFEIGEKIYLYFDVDDSVEGYTIIGKEDRYYIEGGNHRVYYEMLHLLPHNKDLADCWIEDYAAIEDGLSEDDERVVKYKEDYREDRMVSLDKVCEWLRKKTFSLYKWDNGNNSEVGYLTFGITTEDRVIEEFIKDMNG